MNRICAFCSKPFSLRQKPEKESHGRFCSRRCYFESKRAEFDLTGKTFGKLTVISRVDGRTVQFLCRCTCGREKPVFACHLKRGTTIGCGKCGGRGLRKMPEHIAWENMLARCRNPNHPNYPNYGGRGIRVCDRWASSFEAFLQDAGRRPSAAHSIDRINVNGNYEPGNVRWATRSQQMRNTRLTTLLTIMGITRPLADWGDDIGLSRSGLRKRIALGWDPLDAVTSPVRGVPIEIVVVQPDDPVFQAAAGGHE